MSCERCHGSGVVEFERVEDCPGGEEYRDEMPCPDCQPKADPRQERLAFWALAIVRTAVRLEKWVAHRAPAVMLQGDLGLIERRIADFRLALASRDSKQGEGLVIPSPASPVAEQGAALAGPAAAPPLEEVIAGQRAHDAARDARVAALLRDILSDGAS